MGEVGWLLIVPVVLAATLLPWLCIRLKRSLNEARFARAMKDFHAQREYLEAKFFEIASSSGMPRGLAWTQCRFADGVAYARDRQTGDLSALVSVTIGFKAVEGGGMEDVEAVKNLRAATAVFFFAGGRWTTQGRAIFNLNPAEAIDFYADDLEMVAQEAEQ